MSIFLPRIRWLRSVGFKVGFGFSAMEPRPDIYTLRHELRKSINDTLARNNITSMYCYGGIEIGSESGGLLFLIEDELKERYADDPAQYGTGG